MTNDLNFLLISLGLSEVEIKVYKVLLDRFDGDANAQDIASESSFSTLTVDTALKKLARYGVVEKLNETQYAPLTTEEVLEIYKKEGKREKAQLVKTREPKKKVVFVAKHRVRDLKNGGLLQKTKVHQPINHKVRVSRPRRRKIGDVVEDWTAEKMVLLPHGEMLELAKYLASEYVNEIFLIYNISGKKEVMDIVERSSIPLNRLLRGLKDRGMVRRRMVIGKNEGGYMRKMTEYKLSQNGLEAIKKSLDSYH